ncbi:MAG: hypothetical protein M3N22_09765, partial [Acidobacteriota bacterium]|nr:hypothetical protein [Acidobacteriota bacterium]
AVHVAPPPVSPLSREETPRWKKVKVSTASWPELQSQFHAVQEYLAGAGWRLRSPRPATKKYSNLVRTYSASAGAQIQSALPPARAFIESVAAYFTEVVQSFLRDWRTWMPSNSADQAEARKRTLIARISRAKSQRQRMRPNMVMPITAWLKQPMASAQGVPRLRKKHL